MVSDRQKVQIVHLGGVFKCLSHTARADRDVGVGMELAKIQLIAVQRQRCPVRFCCLHGTKEQNNKCKTHFQKVFALSGGFF